MNFFATCKIGLESLVSGELKELGIEVTAVHDARVDFSGSFTDMAVALTYLLLVVLLSRALKKLERRLAKSDKR